MTVTLGKQTAQYLDLLEGALDADLEPATCPAGVAPHLEAKGPPPAAAAGRMPQYRRHNALEWGKQQWDAEVDVRACARRGPLPVSVRCPRC